MAYNGLEYKQFFSEKKGKKHYLEKVKKLITLWDNLGVFDSENNPLTTISQDIELISN
jgi:hypothetical protein